MPGPLDERHAVRVLAKVSWLALLLAGCFRSAAGESEPGDAAQPSGEEQGSRAGSGAVPVTPAPDEPLPREPAPPDADDDPSTAFMPDERDVPVSDMQAACLGLDQPVCAVCHGAPNGGGFFLRPRFAPAHPVAASVGSSELLRECGLTD